DRKARLNMDPLIMFTMWIAWAIAITYVIDLCIEGKEPNAKATESKEENGKT
ncbi:unnamed protein product, partial [marine sediment metagenome]